MSKIKTKKAWVVCGCSWNGNWNRRDGKVVTCGHKHKSLKTSERCAKKMRKLRPGNCQDYRAFEIIWIPKVKIGLKLSQ